MQSNYFDILVKIIIVGDVGAGKTSLCNKLIYNNFNKDYITTIGVDYHIYYHQMDNIIYKLQLWDITGQERFNSLIPSFFRGIHIAIIVIDMNDMNAYESILRWYNNIIKFSKEPFNIIIIGNKTDLPINANINMINDFVKIHKITSFIELSIKNTLNLDNLLDLIINKYLILSIKITNNITTNNNKSLCCNFI